MEEFQDKIGRQEIVNKIVELVKTMSHGTNFCLALDGNWGSGKSFTLQMLNSELIKHPEYLIVNYDAWKNNFYPDPLIAILYCVLDGVKEKFHYVKKYSSEAKKVFSKLIKNKSEEEIFNLINDLSKHHFTEKLIAFIIEFIYHLIKVAKSSILDNKLFDEYKSYQSLLRDCTALLNAITQYEEYNNKQTKLIILVDEIDRCLPDEQLKVLERLHHLFKVKNCAVIIAINKSQVQTVYNHYYGGSDRNSGKEYLRKFFDYDFHLDTCAEIYFKNWLQDEIINDDTILKVHPISVEQIELIQQISFDKIHDQYGEKRAIENRTLERTLTQTKNVITCLPDNKIDFAYLYLTCYLVCCKLYDKNTFNKLYKCEENIYYDIFAHKGINNPLLQVVGYTNFLRGISFPHYTSSINTINFYINYWLAKGDKDKINNVKSLFQNNSLNADPDCEIKLKIIFDKIDKIAE